MPDSIQETAYTTFSPTMHEQTASDASTIQSPIYGAFGGTSIPNEVDIQATSILAPPYPYSSPPLTVVQHPQSPPSLDLQARDGHQNHYSTDLTYSSRNRDFASQTSRYRLLPVSDGQSYASDRTLGGPVNSGSEQTFQTTLSLPPPPAVTPEKPAETKTANSKTKEPRKSSSNVVIACHQCRNRKIRCDSTRPSCNNCIRRNNECVYDAAPKRRGPDKHPGARQRSCKKRPADSSAPPPPAKRKRVGDSSIQESEKTMVTPKIKIDTDSVQPAVAHPLSGDSRLGLSPTSPLSAQHPQESKPLSRVEYSSGVTQPAHGPYSPQSYAKSYPRPPEMPIHPPRPEYHIKEQMPLSPVLSQQNWLSSLTLSFPLKDIIAELTFLFDETGFWLSFMNHTTFLQKLADPYAQKSIQPALVYAGLAMATLMKSSELENGRAGHARAAWFRDKAQQALKESWNARWIDVGLAEAALIIAFYEFSANMEHHPDRIEGAIRFLDNIIHTLRLPMTDANRAHVSAFSANSVPIVVNELDGNATRERECACSSNNPVESFSSLAYSPRWDSSWSSKETYEEESRRICWCALSLVLAYYSQCIAFNREPPADLYICNPGNYAIFFPGEVGDRAMASLRSSAVLSPKESVWALYCRSMLLWVYCNRILTDPEQRQPAESTADAWSEMQAIQDALAKHTCNTTLALMYLSREYLHDTRLILTRALRKLQGFDSTPNSSRPDLPLSRKDVEEWVFYVQQTVKRARFSAMHLNAPQGYAITRRPYQVSWFICQLAMCLFLLSQDRTLNSVMQLAKELLPPLGYMCDLFPAPAMRAQYNQLKDQFIDFCNKAGQSPPKLHALPMVRNT